MHIHECVHTMYGFKHLLLEIACGISISISQQMENIVPNAEILKVIHHMSAISLK